MIEVIENLTKVVVKGTREGMIAEETTSEVEIEAEEMTREVNNPLLLK